MSDERLRYLERAHQRIGSLETWVALQRAKCRKGQHTWKDHEYESVHNFLSPEVLDFLTFQMNVRSVSFTTCVFCDKKEYTLWNEDYVELGKWEV